MDQEYTDELQRLLASAKHPKVVALLERALSDAEPKQNGVGATTTVPPVPLAEAGVDSEMKPISKQKDKSVSMAKISSYGWDQSDKFVKIYISNIKGVDQLKTENIRSDFNQSFIKVELFDIQGKNYGLTINNLYAAILPEECTVKVKGDMVIVSLRKTKTQSWECLTSREKKLKDSKERKPPKLDGGGDKSDPSQGLMKMMQQMYDDGDDEMKRTIQKSWYESQQKKKTESGIMDM